MKNKVLSLLVVFVMILSVSVTAYAADPVLAFESSYDAEQNVVAVSIYLENAVGLQAADFRLGYDVEMYEYNSFEKADIEEGIMVCGLAADVEGLCTSSVIFTEKCDESALDENGRLYLTTFTFTPIDKDNYDMDYFYLWAQSYESNDTDLADSIQSFGNSNLMEDRTDIVTQPATTSQQYVQSGSGSKWYVYLIAGVLAVAAIAGIAFVVIKNNHEEDDEASEDSENKE